jgi:hypothetical protein
MVIQRSGGQSMQYLHDARIANELRCRGHELRIEGIKLVRIGVRPICFVVPPMISNAWANALTTSLRENPVLLRDTIGILGSFLSASSEKTSSMADEYTTLPLFLTILSYTKILPSYILDLKFCTSSYKKNFTPVTILDIFYKKNFTPVMKRM